MARSVRHFALVATLHLTAVTPAWAQVGQPASSRGPATGESGAADADSILRAARSAQAAFERTRRRYLTRTHSAPSPTCGEMIGRFCYWDDESTDDVLVRIVPPAESPRIAPARDRLLATLDSARAALPAHDWIVGAQVHYLIEAGRLDGAAERLGECRATAWWCDALRALVEHSGWRYPEADSLFARALGAMPEEERCRWINLGKLLDEPAHAAYRRADCTQREAYNAHIWWLADPLFARAGNDRRTEHYARVTRARIHERAASGYATAWRDDLNEIVRRFGWPSHFAQQPPRPGHSEPPGVTALHDSPSYHFLADVPLEGPLEALADTSWTLRPTRARERHAPPYATFGRLQQLSARFRRGDSLLIVASYDATADSLLARESVTAALVAAEGPTASEFRTVRHDAPMRGTLVVATKGAPVVASVELVGGMRALRARFGVGSLPGAGRALRLSDIALFNPVDSVPADLEEFLPLARASSTVRAGSKLGLYWETYGAPSSGEGLVLDVTIVREGRGWLRRAGERIGLVDRAGRLGFGWRETPRSDDIAPSAVVVDVGQLEPGTYRIDVRLTPEGETPLLASRRIEVVR